MFSFRGAVWTKTGVFAVIFHANANSSTGSCFKARAHAGAHAGIHFLECLYNLTPRAPCRAFSVCHSDINVMQTTVDVSDSPLESPIFFLSV